MSRGSVYILINASMPDLVKIGRAANPEERARVLSQPTGVPAPFQVAHDEEVPDCEKAERAIHKELGQYRVNPNREFFRVPLKEAVKVVMAIAESQRREEQELLEQQRRREEEQRRNNEEQLRREAEKRREEEQRRNREEQLRREAEKRREEERRREISRRQSPPPPDEPTRRSASNPEPVVLELAPLPREQIGPFLLLGLDKDADKEQIEANWARRVIWARKNLTRVPLEDVNWAREVMSDSDRRVRADCAGFNPDTADGLLRRWCGRFGVGGVGGEVSAGWRPLDDERPLADYAPPAEVPDANEVRAALRAPEVPPEVPAVPRLLDQLAREPIDPWAIGSGSALERGRG